MTKFLLDTCLFIDFDKIVQNLPTGDYYISDINLFEILKNQSRELRLKLFKKVCCRMRQHKIGLVARKERFIKSALNSDHCTIKRVDQIGLDVSRNIVKNFTSFVAAILMCVVASKNHVEIKGDEMYSSTPGATKYINIISEILTELWTKSGYDLAKTLYTQSSNPNEDKIEVFLANLLIENYNEYITDENYKIRTIKNFNYHDFVKSNNIQISKKDILNYLNSFITIETNSKLSMGIYTSYAYELFIAGGKIEYNDIIDMNLVSVVISKKSFLITKDNKIKRVLSQFEKEYHSNNSYSKYIININGKTSY